MPPSPLIKKFFFILQLLILLPLYPAARPVSSFSIATGAFDFLRPSHQTWEFSMEYKYPFPLIPTPSWFNLRGVCGIMSTIQGSGYAYGGVNFDILIAKRFLLAPGFAAGYYWIGHGKDLGYPLEFRSGVEAGWQFRNGVRCGLHFYHLSNASLGRKNPGEESLILFYEIPVKILRI